MKFLIKLFQKQTVDVDPEPCIINSQTLLFQIHRNCGFFILTGQLSQLHVDLLGFCETRICIDRFLWASYSDWLVYIDPQLWLIDSINSEC